MPKPCETAARKLLGERMRKSEAPAGFKNKPLLSALPLSEGSADIVCLAMVRILFKTTICYGELGVKQKVWDYTMKGCGDFDLPIFGGNKNCKKSIVQELPSLFFEASEPVAVTG